MKRINATGMLAVACCATGKTLAAAGQASTTVPGPFKPDWRSLKQYTFPDWFKDSKLRSLGPTGGPSVFRSRATGMLGICMNRHTRITSTIWSLPSSVDVRIQGYLQCVEGRKVGSGENDGSLPAGRRSISSPWPTITTISTTGIQVPAMELREYWPQESVVGTWAKIARAHGMRFGVTVHAARAWSWYDVAHGSDAEGPMKGVPYDGGVDPGRRQGSLVGGL